MSQVLFYSKSCQSCDSFWELIDGQGWTIVLANDVLKFQIIYQYSDQIFHQLCLIQHINEKEKRMNQNKQYHNLLSRKDQVTISILESLSSNKQMTQAELIDSSKVSMKTVQKEIMRINNTHSGVTIEQSSKKLLQLRYHQQIPREYIYADVFNQSFEIRMIKNIFLSDEILTIEKLSERMFVSPSTLRRTIRLLNEALTSLDIQIATPKLRLVGDKKQLHYLLYYLMQERHGIPDGEVNTQKINLLIQYFKKVVSLKQQEELFKPFSGLLSEEDVFLLMAINWIIYQEEGLLPKLIIRDFEKAKEWLLFPYSNCLLIATFEELEKIESMYPAVQTLSLQLEGYLSGLTQVADISLDEDRLRLQLLNYLCILNEQPQFLKNTYDSFSQRICTDNLFFTQLKTYTKNYFPTFDSKQLAGIFTQVVLSLDTLDYSWPKFQKKIRTILYSNFGEQHGLFLKKLLEERYGRELQITYISNKKSFEEQLKKQTDTVDLILSTQRINNTLPYHIGLSHYPSTEEYDYLNQFVINFYQTN